MEEVCIHQISGKFLTAITINRSQFQIRTLLFPLFLLPKFPSFPNAWKISLSPSSLEERSTTNIINSCRTVSTPSPPVKDLHDPPGNTLLPFLLLFFTTPILPFLLTSLSLYFCPFLLSSPAHFQTNIDSMGLVGFNREGIWRAHNSRDPLSPAHFPSSPEIY